MIQNLYSHANMFQAHTLMHMYINSHIHILKYIHGSESLMK